MNRSVLWLIACCAVANLIRIAWVVYAFPNFPKCCLFFHKYWRKCLNARFLPLWLIACCAVVNLIRFCSYPRLRFDCVGLFYAFANAVYIFANIGANA